MGAMAEIELVEDDDPPRTPDASPADHGPRSSRLRRLRWIAAGAVGVLAVGVVGTQLVIDARQRALAARYADVPGVLAPLRPDLTVLWRTAPDEPQTDGFAPRIAVGDVVMRGTASGVGTITLDGVDAATGDPLWAQTVSVPGATASDDPLVSPQISCAATALYRREFGGPVTPGPVDVDGTAICVVTTLTLMVETRFDNASSNQFSAGYTTLLVVDTVTGEVAERADLPYGTYASPLPDGYVTKVPDVLPDPSWESIDVVPTVASTISRYTWGEQDPRWSFRTEPLDLVDNGWLSATEDGRRMSVSVGSTAWLVDDRTGAFLDTRGAADTDATGGQRWASYGLLPDDATLVTTSGSDGSSSTTLVTRDGEHVDLDDLSTVQAYPDDGSTAGLLLARVQDPDTGVGALTAIDLGTGEQAWTSKAEVSWSIVVLDGIVYSLAMDTLWAVDASDGSVLWSTHLQHTEGWLLTDGSVAVVSADGRLDAYDLGSGAVAWSAAIVLGEDGPQLIPVPDGPTASPTKPDGSRWAPWTDGYISAAGRRLAWMTSSGGLVVLG
ncbi:outer membrane protein assembly factor BamB family protein [Cellulomonas soli]|uniref:Pyrrolo-quinoline quinone repeat domain-containing protein n=1 Tax=Cellulomonas soli TaxID=931535 RepID=A0A512PEU7_9CELL|nr:PQQ-binding-like beta-propeller repeat protein [Cellulomonas soli]NYI59478.1 hypothetical protein [Cellulomonas soli]GEP69730.1 hypothetical protein CSO01_24450 [Cellulomonas soli]